MQEQGVDMLGLMTFFNLIDPEFQLLILLVNVGGEVVILINQQGDHVHQDRH